MFIRILSSSGHNNCETRGAWKLLKSQPLAVVRITLTQSCGVHACSNLSGTQLSRLTGFKMCIAMLSSLLCLGQIFIGHQENFVLIIVSTLLLTVVQPGCASVGTVTMLSTLQAFASC